MYSPTRSACPSEASQARASRSPPRNSGIAPRRSRHTAPPGVGAFAGFGVPPNALLETPAYAMRVLRRSWMLRRLLAIAREQESRDVGLYEASLRSADLRSVASGLAVVSGVIMMCIVVVAVLSQM